MKAPGERSLGRRRVAALGAVAGLAAFLIGSVAISTEIAPPSGDPAAPDAILEAGFVEFSFSPFVYGVIAIVIVVTAVLLLRRNSAGSGGGILLGVGISLGSALRGVYASWTHPDLSATAAGWGLAAGPVLIAVAGGVAAHGGPRGRALPGWGLLGAGAVAVAPFLSVATNRTGTNVLPNEPALPFALVETAFVLAIAVAQLFPTARRRFLTGALLGIGLLNVTFAIQGLATWGPTPIFAVGPATYLRLGGGLLLLGASTLRVQRPGRPDPDGIASP